MTWPQVLHSLSKGFVPDPCVRDPIGLLTVGPAAISLWVDLAADDEARISPAGIDRWESHLAG